MKTLIIINDPPYGGERCYNALRLAHALIKRAPHSEMVLFLMADAVLAAKAGQKTPEGYYNVERMVKRVIAGEGNVLLCGSCMDARGISDVDLIEAARRSTMDELADAAISAEKVFVF